MMNIMVNMKEMQKKISCCQRKGSLQSYSSMRKKPSKILAMVLSGEIIKDFCFLLWVFTFANLCREQALLLSSGEKTV